MLQLQSIFCIIIYLDCVSLIHSVRVGSLTCVVLCSDASI